MACPAGNGENHQAAGNDQAAKEGRVAFEGEPAGMIVVGVFFLSRLVPLPPPVESCKCDDRQDIEQMHENGVIEGELGYLGDFAVALRR